MTARVDISASYAATDGSMPESVSVTIEPGDVGEVSSLDPWVMDKALVILELLLSAPAQRHGQLGEPS